MKKLVLLTVFIASVLGLSAQSAKGETSALGQIGYQSDFERLFVGVQGRYNIIDHLRVAPDAMFFFPKDKVVGLDVNINLHYVFDIADKMEVYPLSGFAMQNNRYMGETVNGVKRKAVGSTDLGFNLGGGFSYNFQDNLFLNAEMKYMFIDSDSFLLGIGIGYKF